MIALPNVCLIEIFNKLKDYYRFLFSCLLVNRLWCRNVIPILWSDPNFRDKRIIKICLLSLNTEEKVPLIQFKILPSNDQNLFLITLLIIHQLVVVI
ncbi:hypothetical protein F8M41_024752 [Gigaspora margarita]|uniref:F-box domain-containing protein n=1 Tax=Gigaspora margarita TaxID=4874 RepID=A0A8H3XJP2_GIGMA|nr:hypothetical protein F8M41_024752 [Gigaspora margarita]